MVYLFGMKGLLLALLVFAHQAAFAQAVSFEELEDQARYHVLHNQRDSVKRVAMQMQKMSDQSALWDAKARYYLSEGVLYEDPEKSIAYAAEALKFFKESAEPLFTIRTLKSLGNGYKLTYEYDSAVTAFEKGLQLIADLEVKQVRLEALLNYGLGAALRERSKYEEAINRLQRASDLSEELRDSTIQISASIQIAALFFEIENYEKSKAYFMRANGLARSPDFENLQYFIDNGLAHIYRVNNQQDSALISFGAAYRNAIEYGDEVNASVYLFNIADLLLAMGKYDSAQSINREMMDVSSRLGLKENLAFGHEINSQIFSSRRQYQSAINSALKSVELSEEIGDPQQLGKAYGNLFEIYQNSGDYRKALKAYIRQDAISDSLLSRQNIKTVEELETKYESEKKDRSIEALTQKNQIQDLRLSQQRLWLFVSFIGIIGMILFVTVIYLRNKRRIAEQAKESEDLRQKLLRIQLNPHFTYNSLNAIQSMIYENKDKQKTADYLSSFSSLMRNILELNQRDYITLEEELDFIENYIEVQQMRFDQPITYHMKVEDQLELDRLLIPPMITQPFLENAFEHGFPDKSKSGELWIAIRQADEWLTIDVSDDGVGRANSKKKTKGHNSMATRITEERLSNISTIFKRESGVAINDLHEFGVKRGTHVSIKLPLIYD